MGYFYAPYIPRFMTALTDKDFYPDPISDELLNDINNYKIDISNSELRTKILYFVVQFFNIDKNNIKISQAYLLLFRENFSNMIKACRFLGLLIVIYPDANSLHTDAMLYKLSVDFVKGFEDEIKFFLDL